MKIRTLASSSSGNCTIVYDDTTKILIDAGIKLADLEMKFSAMEIDIDKLNAVLITHEHIDHVRSAGALARKYKVPVYVHNMNIEVVQKKLGKVNKDLIIPIYEDYFTIGEFSIKPFLLPHDANVCVGYNVEKNNKKFSIATDLGHITDEIIANLYKSDLVILESNHDEKMLLQNPNYSSLLKSRILGKTGHLSNKTAAKAICDLAANDVKHIILGHLSEENNTPEIALNTIKEYLETLDPQIKEKVGISVAPPHLIGPLFHIK